MIRPRLTNLGKLYPQHCRQKQCLWNRVRRSTMSTLVENENSEVVVSSTKPRTNIPFAKDLFLGRFDKSRLVFPEVLTKEQLEDLDQMIQPIDRYFTEQLDSKSLDVNAKIPEEVLQQLKELGLFGMQIPAQYGGLELNATQYARINEFTSIDASIAVTLAAHQAIGLKRYISGKKGIAVTLAAHQAIGLKGILLTGTPAQKEKYLPRLATGEHIAAFCLTEPSSGSDAASVQTRATLSEDGKTYHLNGGKIWISNGGIAEIFTVFAKTSQTEETTGKTMDKVTAFIVERCFGGVTSGKPEDKLGIRGSNTCEVHFENTPVPVENVLGSVGGGFKVAVNILNSGRFSMGSSSAGGIRKLMEMVAEHAVTRKQFGKPLSEFGLIQEKFTKMAVSAYVMESMSYMTAAIIDSCERPDASVEAAMVKVYSSENAWTSINDALQIMGGMGYMKDYPFERYLRDARILQIFEGTNEILRLYIALTGMQHAGKELRDLLRKMKSPFGNFGTMFNYAVSSKAKLKLANEVIPILRPFTEEFEQRVVAFKDAVQGLLSIYSDKIIDEQLLLKRVADISTDLYAMTCVIARASRSMSIGLRNADHEIKLVTLFCVEACYRIDNNINMLKFGKTRSGDNLYEDIAKDLFEHKGYMATHPLTRNWD